MNYNVEIEDSLFQKIGKIKVCHICVIMLFFLSFINSGLLISFLLLSPIILLNQEGIIDGSLYMLLYVQTRSILNKSLAVEFTGLPSIIKWFIVFILSFLLIYKKSKSISSSIFNSLVIYVSFLLFISFFCSSYPIVSAFKVISFAVPFYAVLCGVVSSSKCWIEILNVFLGLLVILSFFSMIIGTGNYVTIYGATNFFCGALNHPNLLGSILTLCTACCLSYNKKLSFIRILYLILVFIMIYMCKSRAAFFYFFIVLCLHILENSKSVNIKVIRIILLFTIITISIFAFSEFLLNVMYKYGDNGIMDSRTSQVNGLISRILYNPLFGTGFNVPFAEGVKDFRFAFSLPVENGNLFLGVLADSGFIGLILFLYLYFNIYKSGKGLLFFITPMLISMTEMSFFATNNIGLFLYFFYGIYLSHIRLFSQDISKKFVTKKVSL